MSNFESALHSGFLNGLCPALTDLIYDDDLLIGYITKEGKTCFAKGLPILLDYNEYIKLTEREKVIDMTSEFEKIHSFLTTVLRNCKKHSKIFYDLDPRNIVEVDGQYSLIDLESVYDLNELNLLPTHNAQIKPPNTLEFINKI